MTDTRLDYGVSRDYRPCAKCGTLQRADGLKDGACVNVIFCEGAKATRPKPPPANPAE